MAKQGRMLAPDGIKKIISVGLDSCKEAVANNAVMGEAEFSFALDGEYSVDKDGGMGIKANVAYIDGLPINVEPTGSSSYDADSSGNITISFAVKMRNKP